MSIKWTRLELWKASSLAADTAKATELYNKYLEEGNNAALVPLRAEIEARIDDLAAFYAENVDDERGVLFEKQRMHLRKLLHQSARKGRAASAPSQVTLAEVLVWFLNTGSKDHPWLSEEQVQGFYARLAATSTTGRISMSDFLALVAQATPAETYQAAPSTPAAAAAPLSQASSPTASVGTSVTSASGRRRRAKAIYAWEKQAQQEEEEEDGIDADALVELKGGVLEFQIVMSPTEYAAYACRRRARAAENKHLSRTSRTPKPKARETPSVAQTGPYVEPSTLETHFFRTDTREKWMTNRGFTRSPTGSHRRA